ncbi:MAG: L,D-transpeptidase family protein [Proteobacteria bacterium]|nr:L,D-transpeptidase family protein [Pseudomonadota bacterium]
MKKSLFLTLMMALLAGCSGQAENQIESAASQNGDRNSEKELIQWVDRFQRNPDVLASLNAPVLKSDNGAELGDLCGDASVREAMADRDYQTVVAKDDVSKAIDILHSIPEHGSKYEPAHLAEIEELAQKVGQDQKLPEFSWQDEDSTVLLANLKKSGFSVDKSEESQTALVAMLKGNDCEKVLPRYCEYVQKLQNMSAETLKDSRRLDALLTCDLVGWAGELRLNYPKNDYKFDRFRKYVSDEEIVSIRKKNFVQELAKYGVDKSFQHIAPPDPQYELLKQARKLYVEAAASGGWPAVEAPAKITEPKLDKTYDYVPALRKRLKAEGYPVEDLDSNVLDQKLVDAIVLYRDVHQLSTKKVVDNVLFKNMSVSPKDRLDMIDLAMQHYREEAIGSLNYYVKVNVPDFHVEVWKDGQRMARHRIVVGNNNVQKDPVTKKVVPDPETLYPLHPNRTPLQTSKINEIIYQPYWNVPARIRIEELEPKLAENPNYYVEHNYEEVNVGDPKLYYVRELPNPKNSLGQVKFMFPNPHNTYLHDTPAKAVFSNPVRAYSHGCMRVHKPLDLAELLLKNDGQWDAQKVHNILTANPAEQVTIELKHPVDVDVVYINARVDDSGVVAFLSDIYQYDAVRTGKVVLQKLPRPRN